MRRFPALLLAAATFLVPATSPNTPAIAAPVPVTGLAATGDPVTSESARGPGRAWPRGRITYVDRTNYPDAVRRAVRAWNRSGLNVRFVKARPARKPQLVIAHQQGMTCAFGIATVGYTSRAYAYVGGSDYEGDPCPWPEVTLKTTHELGHVLGLDHISETSCAIMNPDTTNGVAPSGCIGPDDDAKPGRWWCRMISRPDLRRARRLYGGTVQVRSPEWCDAYPMIPQTGPVTASASGVGNALRLTLTRAPEPPVPDWILDGDSVFDPGVEIHVSNDGCPSSPESPHTYVTSESWGAVPVGGTLEVLTFAPEQVFPGQTCVSVWQYDAGYNYAVAPATATVQLSAPVE